MSLNVVVLSGGLDSTVCMALAAKDQGGAPLALTFEYGQRHLIEVQRAAEIARHFGSQQLVVKLDARAWGGSALTDGSIDVPQHPVSAEPDTSSSLPGDTRSAVSCDPASCNRETIPSTYVPARNIIFLAVALGVSEARDADAVYLGVNSLDYSGYPDCRPEFIDAFVRVAEVGQKRGIEGRPVDIRTPLISMTKANIVSLGTQLGAPLELTWSCYLGGPAPCGQCDACRFRAGGFATAGIVDPSRALR